MLVWPSEMSTRRSASRGARASKHMIYPSNFTAVVFAPHSSTATRSPAEGL